MSNQTPSYSDTPPTNGDAHSSPSTEETPFSEQTETNTGNTVDGVSNQDSNESPVVSGAGATRNESPPPEQQPIGMSMSVPNVMPWQAPDFYLRHIGAVCQSEIPSAPMNLPADSTVVDPGNDSEGSNQAE